jgi:hexosaminidase
MIALSPLALSFAAPSSDLPTIWPAASTSSSGTGVRTVVPSAAFFRLSTGSSPLLEAAFERYAGLTFPHAADAPSLDTGASALGCEVPSAASAAITYMRIEVADLAEDHPRLETDESYTLSISDDGAEPAVHGSAQTVYGALRLLETFSQLVAFDFDCGRYEVGGAPWRITDAPRFAHRGLMLDTARHYG